MTGTKEKTGRLIGPKLVPGLLLLILVLVSLASAQVRPDLIASKVQVEEDTQGFIIKVTVSVTNVCREAPAPASYVLITFKQSAEQNAKTILFVGNIVKALKGGESYALSFPITEMKIAKGRHLVVEVDPYRKVPEANEDNNWWKLNPDSKPPLPSGQDQCSPKSKEK